MTSRRYLKDGVIPSDLILSAKSFRKACVGLKPPKGTWCHVTGTDLVRDSDGKYYVLEDNLRCPSGVSYVLQNREIMKRTFPQIFDHSNVRPVGDYPSHLLQTLAGHRASGNRLADGRGADAGNLQLCILRACIPGEIHGSRTRRRPRPRRDEWPRHDAHDERIRARGCHLPQDR